MNSKVLRISRARTLESLSKLRGEDPDLDHKTATEAVLEHLRLIGETDVASTYEKAMRRCRFFP